MVAGGGWIGIDQTINKRSHRDGDRGRDGLASEFEEEAMGEGVLCILDGVSQMKNQHMRTLVRRSITRYVSGPRIDLIEVLLLSRLH